MTEKKPDKESGKSNSEPFKQSDFDEELYRIELTKIVEEEMDWAYNWGPEDMIELILELEKKWGAFNGC